MAKRKTENQKLREELKLYKDLTEMYRKENAKLLENGEYSYLNSPTYHQNKERISFLENCEKLNEWNLQNVESKTIRVEDAVRQVHEDNKRILANQDCPEYFIGITENFHSAEEFIALKEKIAGLEGKIRGMKTTLQNREEEIRRLQAEIGMLEYSQSVSVEKNPDTPGKSDTNHMPVTESPEYQKLKEENIRLMERLEHMGRGEGNLGFEDAVCCQEAQERIRSLEEELKESQRCVQNCTDRISDLQKQNTSLALSMGNAVEIAEKNMEKTKKLRESNRKKQGRPSKVDEHQIALIRELHRNGHSIRDIAGQLGLAPGTVNKYTKKEK